MPRVSKYYLQSNELKNLTEHFSYLISSLSKSSDIENFLKDFFTKEEKLMLSKRLVLFMMIKRGYSPTIIQSALHVSYETVRTYNNQFQTKNQEFQKTIDRLIERDKSKEFWKKVDKLLKPVELVLSAKRDMKSRAKLLSGYSE